jgi:2,3-bisphosphoglycerate-independent phosphoglycerate mutase
VNAGLGRRREADAIEAAEMPFWRSLLGEWPHARLEASGEAVGLPAGQMGNSEVGHLNLGAGAVVPQDLTRIDQAIEDGSFAENDVLRAACEAVVSEVGAQGLRDVGRCMGTLKERYPGRMDFGKASRVVKDMLK